LLQWEWVLWVGGMGVSSVVGGIGFVAPKVGLAFGIGTVPIAGMGAVLGLAAYGVAKMLDTSQVEETPLQVVERMEEKVLNQEFYIDALIELNSFLAGEELNQKFAALEIEAELEAMKAQEKQQVIPPQSSPPQIKHPQHQTAEIWQCVQTLKGHSAGINAIAISLDSKILISGSNDKTVSVWNLNTGKWLYSFYGQAEAVLSVAISPDGKQIISGSVDRKISSWQLDRKQYHRTFSYLNSPYSHDGFVNSLTYSADGRIIASGSTDKKLEYGMVMQVR
jgi:hypothetical protein